MKKHLIWFLFLTQISFGQSLTSCYECTGYALLSLSTGPWSIDGLFRVDLNDGELEYIEDSDIEFSLLGKAFGLVNDGAFLYTVSRNIYCAEYLHPCMTSFGYLHKYDYQGNLIEFWSLGDLSGYEGGMDLDPVTGDIILVTSNKLFEGDEESTPGNNVYRIPLDGSQMELLGYFSNSKGVSNPSSAAFNENGELVVGMDYMPWSPSNASIRMYKIDLSSPSPFPKTLINSCSVASELLIDSEEVLHNGAMGFSSIENKYYTIDSELCDIGGEGYYSLYSHSEEDGTVLIGTPTIDNETVIASENEETELYGFSGLAVHCGINESVDPFEVLILNGSDSLTALSMDVACGSQINLQYVVQPLLNGQINETITLEAVIPTGYGIIPGDGFNSFDADHKVIIQNLGPWGHLINLNLIANSFLPEGTISTIEIQPENLKTTPALCNAPIVNLISQAICYGDGNGDGYISAADLTGILALYGNASDPCGAFDFNNDSLVTSSDLTAFLAVFGNQCQIEGRKISSNTNPLSKINAATMGQENYDLLIDIFGQDLNVKVFPNPGHDLFEITIHGINAADRPSSIAIFDALGTKVHQSNTKAESVQINSTHWPAGIYICRVEKAGLVSVQKFIKE